MKKKTSIPLHKHLHRHLTSVTPATKLTAMILFVVLPFIGFYFGIEYAKIALTPSQPTIVVPANPPDEPITGICTMDAKICPDGSAVDRIPPACEFAACPASPSAY